MKDWKLRAAKRMIAKDAVARATQEFAEIETTGGALTAGSNYRYTVIMHLLRHAAEQLRLSEGTK